MLSGFPVISGKTGISAMNWADRLINAIQVQAVDASRGYHTLLALDRERVCQNSLQSPLSWLQIEDLPSPLDIYELSGQQK